MKKSILNKSALTALAFATLFSCGKDDGPEDPINTAPKITAQSFNASEDANDTTVFGKVVATDAEKDALTFNLKTNSNALFEITNTGDISLAAGKTLDFETAASHTLSVDVTDGKLTSNAAVTITVVDVDENVAPTIAAQTFSIDENSATNTVIGTVAATDVDGDPLTFSSSNLGSLFALSTSGELTVDGDLNFEDSASYTISVTANDGQLDATAQVVITINDVNDAPLFDPDMVSFDATESLSDTATINGVTATDEDGDTLVYSITNDSEDLFELKESSAGLFKLQTGKSLDFETSTAHTFTLVATDPDGATDEVEVTINVLDVAEPQVITVSTFAGSGFSGNANGSGTAATFNRPNGIAIASNGDVYVADENNSAIRKITTDGTVTTFVDITAGNGLIESPTDLVFDSKGNLFVTDASAHGIFKIDPSGNVTPFAGTGPRDFVDGTGTAARFGNVQGIAIDANDNLYVADNSWNRIRKITPAAVVTTIIGDNRRGNVDGPLADARFGEPQDVVVDAAGNFYLVDTNNYSIRKVTPSGQVTTLAGSTQGFANGTGVNAQFSSIRKLAIDSKGNLYTTDGVTSYRIRKITPSGEVTTLVGDAGNGFPGRVNGDSSIATFGNVRGIAISADDKTLYVTEYTQHRIRKITITE